MYIYAIKLPIKWKWRMAVVYWNMDTWANKANLIVLLQHAGCWWKWRRVKIPISNHALNYFIPRLLSSFLACWRRAWEQAVDGSSCFQEQGYQAWRSREGRINLISMLTFHAGSTWEATGCTCHCSIVGRKRCCSCILASFPGPPVVQFLIT